ncbi:MAG: hypothetical protein WCG80_00145 [Spirochaetales bacterium]
MSYDQATFCSMTGTPETVKEVKTFLNDQTIPDRLAELLPTDYFDTEEFGLASRLVLKGDLGMGNFDCEDALLELSAWFPLLTFVLTVDLFEDGRDVTTIRAGEVVDSDHEDPEEEEEEEEEED